MLNSIPRVVTRDDLLDRFICLNLPEIPEEEYRARSKVQAELEALQPAAFGALHNVKPRTRMADFALLGEAIARGMGKKPGYFLTIYKAALVAGAGDVIGETPVSAAVRAYIAANPNGISGTIDQIGPQLKLKIATPELARAWPTTGRAFGDGMTRIEANLEKIGILVTRKSCNIGTFYTIKSAAND